MRKLIFLVAVVLSIGAAAPNAYAGCYRMGETGYHWYRSCLGFYWFYPHHRICRHGYCWYR